MKLIETVKSIFAEISEEDINLIKTIEIDSSKILIILDKALLETEEDLYISISLNNSCINKVSL